MKLKIVGLVMVVAILILGVAIFRLHTKDVSTPAVEVKQPEAPAPVVVLPPVLPPKKVVVPPQPEPVCQPLEIRHGHIVKELR